MSGLAHIEATAVPVVRGRDRLAVTTPYHPLFPDRAKALGGKWDHTRRVWVFDSRDSDRVAALCTELFGYDWVTIHSTEAVDVRLTLPPPLYEGKEGVFGFARWLIHRSRSNWVTLGDGVLLLGGSFLAESGDLALEVRDVAEPLYARERYSWEDRGATVDVVSQPPQRTFPGEPKVNVLPLDHEPAVAEILKLWDRLSARQQGRLLDVLRDRLPGG